MQLFCVSSGLSSVDEGLLRGALAEAGGAFPRFGEGPAWSATSASGAVVVAGMHHPLDLLGPRSYCARAGDVVVAFDGLPVQRAGAWPAHDAEMLLRHWPAVPDLVEGQFVALRVDLALDQVAFVTDAFGIVPLYHLAFGGGHLVANSVEVLRRVTGAGMPSPLGVSSFAAMGWTAGDTTLIAGIRALAGGHEYRLSRSGLRAVPHLTSATVAARARSGRRISTDQIVTELVELTSAAVAVRIPIRCGLTAGRDSRVLVALLQATGASDARYYTGGHDGNPDVDGARMVARELGLEHEVIPLEKLDDEIDRLTLLKMFVAQTDGLSSLRQIGDYNDQLRAPATLGLKMPGLGGEFGRLSHFDVLAYGAHVPLFMFSDRAQEFLISRRSRENRRFLTREALYEVNDYLHRFVRDRRDEGWKTREVPETYYVWDRVARWGATSLRRTSGTDDVFTPFCSRAFVEYCFSLRPEQRYQEASHYRILSAISPTLRDLPFDYPWKAQRPREVPFRASYDLAKNVAKVARHRLPSINGRDTGSLSPRQPFWRAWFDAQTDSHLELCLSVPESPLWAWIDKRAVEGALRATVHETDRRREVLARIMTLFWYFYGARISAPSSA